MVCLLDISMAQNPNFTLQASGSVTDFVIDSNLLYAATDQGVVDVFDIKDKQSTDQIRLPFIKDFMGENIPPKVYSIDKIGDTILLLIQGIHGFRDLILISEGSFIKVIDSEKDKMLIKKARFIDKTKVLLGLLSDELVLFDLKENKIIYRIQVRSYSFSDFCLNEDHTEVIVADESGVLSLINTENGKLIKEFEGNNVDNVYQVDYKNDVILSGGQDRRLGIYKRYIDDPYYIQGDFLIYCVGLSSDGTLGAYSANEDNGIRIINTGTKEEVKTLKGHKNTLTGIQFISKDEIISSAEDALIMFWKIE